MTSIYTKEEVDLLFKEIRDLIRGSGSASAVEIAGIKESISQKFNELFGICHDNKNRIDAIDARFKEAQKIPKRETDRHDPR